MTRDLRVIQAAAERLGIAAHVDHLGGGTYALISDTITVGPATYQGDGAFRGRPGDFCLADEEDLIHLGSKDAEVIASLMADRLGLVMTCGTCERRYADNTPAGRCPWEADHPQSADEPVPAAQVILYGNPVDGLKVIGPFSDIDDAITFGDDELDGVDWCVAPLETPAQR